MKLHENQLNLIRHLILLNILSYEDCLKFLDTENTGDMIAMSYIFRPFDQERIYFQKQGWYCDHSAKRQESVPE